MPEESLVARLRALEAILSRAADLRVRVENDPLWLVEYGHVEDAVGEAADALERAEKERDEAHARAGPSAAELNRVLGAPGESFTGRAGCPPKAQEE